jgi:hypothetical protein
VSWLAMKSRLESRLILSAGKYVIGCVSGRVLKVAVRGGASIAPAA